MNKNIIIEMSGGQLLGKPVAALPVRVIYVDHALVTHQAHELEQWPSLPGALVAACRTSGIDVSDSLANEIEFALHDSCRPRVVDRELRVRLGAQLGAQSLSARTPEGRLQGTVALEYFDGKLQGVCIDGDGVTLCRVTLS